MNDRVFVRAVFWFGVGFIVSYIIAVRRVEPEQRTVELPCVVIEVVDGRNPWERGPVKPKGTHP